MTNIELFFDLVFVFAVTQLSHRLLHHPSPLGAIQTLLLFLAVWWVWIDTSSVTNWLDPDRIAVQPAAACADVGRSGDVDLSARGFRRQRNLFRRRPCLHSVGRSVFVLWAGRFLGAGVPGLGRSTTSDWDVEDEHLAERCSLLFIIALGEAILVTGVAFAELPWSLPAASSPPPSPTTLSLRRRRRTTERA